MTFYPTWKEKKEPKTINELIDSFGGQVSIITNNRQAVDFKKDSFYKWLLVNNLGVYASYEIPKLTVVNYDSMNYKH